MERGSSWGRRHWMPLSAKLAKFGFAGLPLQILGMVLNYSLVCLAGMPKPAAYAVVVGAQLVASFALCTRWIFDTEQQFSPRRFLNFAVLMFSLRGVDWLAYTGLVSLHVPFLIAQATVVGVLSIPKFVLMRLLFEPSSRPGWLAGLRTRLFCNHH